MSASDADFAALLPAPALRPYIAYYLGFRTSGLQPSVHSGLPTRHAGLAISLAGPIDIVRMPDTRRPPSSFNALVSGLQIGPTTVRYGDSGGVFIWLRPLGVRSVLGVASTEMSNRVIEFSCIWGKAALRLVERLHAATTWHERFTILDHAFLTVLKPLTLQPELVWAWKRLAETHGSIPVHQLASEICWSRRHFRERFQCALGVPPKTAARIFRFERAVQLIKRNGLRLASVATECGYHDQAHMTLEWNALAGCTPKAWISKELPFFQYSEPQGGDNCYGDDRFKDRIAHSDRGQF